MHNFIFSRYSDAVHGSHVHCTFISSLSLKHHLYADDIQLFLSFVRPILTGDIDIAMSVRHTLVLCING